jgi:hypothetical protein
MRNLQAVADALLYLASGWIWFGSSGLALAVLWLVSRRPIAAPAAADRIGLPDPELLIFAHVDDFRVLIICRDGRRLEVFRDELSALDWARLRRTCFCLAGNQPATGRNTSS